MKCLSCSSSKSCNKLFLPKTKSPSVTNSFKKLNLDDVELNSKKLKNKFYYKNPEFLNESNINKQINILLTNVTNKRSNNKLPKISLDDDNKSCVIKNHYLKTNNNNIKCIDELPKINTEKKNTFIINKYNSKNSSTKNKKIIFITVFFQIIIYSKKNRIISIIN